MPSDTPWKQFVRDVIDQDKQVDAAHRTGIDQTTISRWLTAIGGAPSPRRVVQFARGYDINPIEALVAAELITRAEAALPRTPRRIDLTTVPVGQLIREVSRRATAEVAS